MPKMSSGNIAVTVIPQANGCCVCEITPSLQGRTDPLKTYHGNREPRHRPGLGGPRPDIPGGRGGGAEY